jgi:hypothetical protein
MKALPSLLVIAGAAVALGACSDTDERVLESTPGENGAVMVVGQAYTVDDYLTYLRIFPEVPAGNVDFSEFREFGNANAYAFGGYVFVEEDGVVTRFTVNDQLELVEGPAIAWTNYGIASANASYTVFASIDRAYTFAPELGVVLMWNANDMTLTGTLPLDLPERPASMETWAYDGHLIGDTVVWNVFSGDFDAVSSFPGVTLAFADAQSDEPVRIVEDDRCLGGGPSRVAEDGTYYVQAAAYYGYFYAYGATPGARTCMLRLTPGADSLDPGFMVDYQSLTGSYVSDLWLPVGGSRYVVRAWDPGVAFPENPDEFWDNAALRALIVDTETGSSEPYPDLDGLVSIDGKARDVDGVSYYQINQTGYDVGGEVDVVELHPDRVRQKFHLSGFLLGLERVR